MDAQNGAAVVAAACRFSPTVDVLSPAVFQSLACAHCLFYIYFVTPPYSRNYATTFCDERGLLICPRSSSRDFAAASRNSIRSAFDDTDYDSASNSSTVTVAGEYDPSTRRDCTCENSPQRIYNLPKFALNSSISSIEHLKLTPSLPADFALIVGHCCEAAARCCRNVLQTDTRAASTTTINVAINYGVRRNVTRRKSALSDIYYNERMATCPATWDGWQCFERSPPGALSAACPNYIFGDRIRNDIDGVIAVRKKCLADGKWYTIMREHGTIEWTDYSGCVANEAYTLKLFAGLLAFGITVVTIIPAIFVFTLHRSLRNQPMFVIHRHLLYSFLFSGIFYIFNSLFFAIDGAPGDHLYFMNHLSCRLLFTIQLRFFRLSTFSWMLGEGVYLYRLLMCTFSSSVEPLRPYFITCWGLPFVITIVYSILREAFDNEECWITPTKYWLIEWTIIGPCLLALTINLMLMSVIFCVLIKKLRCNPRLEPAQYTKAVRAVCLLVPVFGLHFLITIYRIQSYLHQIVNLVLDGLQGFVVVLIVCYTNRTVIESVRSWIQQKREEQKLRRQSEDHKMRFKRSIQKSHSHNNITITRNSKSQLSRLGSQQTQFSTAVTVFTLKDHNAAAVSSSTENGILSTFF